MADTRKRRKKLTIAQKNMNKKIKRELQEEGFLPPDKKRLNRKQFALDVLKEVNSDNFSFYADLSYISRGFSWMIPSYHNEKILSHVTAEQIGALKVLKIAIDMKAFWKAKDSEGITEVNIQEIYDTVVKPILNL